MTILSTVDKMVAIMRRDLLTASRYPAGFLASAAGTAVQLAAFYYLSRAIGTSFKPDGLVYFPFVLVGTGVFTLWLATINSFVQVVREAQQAGTLEVLLTTSTRPAVLVGLSSVSAVAGSGLQFLLYIAAGLLISRAGIHDDFFGFLAAFTVSLLSAIALGMLAAAVQLYAHRGSALLWLFGSGAWFLTGTIFPVRVLPRSLQSVAALIPVTHAVNAMRAALMTGAGSSALRQELGVLVLYSCALLPIGMWAFRLALHRAKVGGTLSYY